MSIFEKNKLLGIIKDILKATIYKPGTVATIIQGPLKGYKYKISENSGWSPIYGGWEPVASQVYHQFVKPGYTVYDLGANTGIHSLLFSKLVGKTGKVFAMEPLPENIKEIESIISLNHVENIEIIDKAIAEKSGTLKFKMGNTNKQGSLVGIGCETGDEIEVKVTTLDQLIHTGLPLPDFIKIDIEGAESLAVEGFSQSINQSYPIFAIDLHTPEQDVKVGKFFQKHGYKLYRLGDENAKRFTNQTEILVEINKMDSGWPDPDGVWGTIIAIHPQREQNK